MLDPRAAPRSGFVQTVFPLADDAFELLLTNRPEEFGRFSFNVIDDLDSLVLKRERFQQLSSFNEPQLRRIAIAQEQKVETKY
jgi:hypothetical protein